MKRVALLLVATMLGLFVIAGVAVALPSETPDNTPGVNGPIRAIDQVGTNVWVGGNFTQVRERNGSVVANVDKLAVFDAVTGQFRNIAPRLGGSGPVFDIDVYGNNVVVAGKFTGPTSSQKNLVVLDGTTGAVVRWYNTSGLTAVLAAPQLGRIYGGGKSLSAFQFAGGGSTAIWTRATTTVDPDIRPHNTTNGYRDLELDGSTIWAACACDAVNGSPAKALVKLDTEGNHDASWVTEAGVGAFGISVVDGGGALYLAAGGNDFLAEYGKAEGGGRGWIRDTSGSAQVVEIMDGRLVVGGHFWEIADQGGDRCGNRSANNDVTLDPFDECQTRHGLAAYTTSGALDPDFSPMYAGRYNLVWALRVDDLDPGKLHTGGDFTNVNGVSQVNYARLSTPPLP